MMSVMGVSALLALLSTSEAVLLRSGKPRPWDEMHPGFWHPWDPAKDSPYFADGRGMTEMKFRKQGGKAPFPVSHTDKERAMEDHHITCENTTVYGAMAPKVPDYVVHDVNAEKLALGPTKTHNFNFQGALDQNNHIRFKIYRMNPREAKVLGSPLHAKRNWVAEFAKDNFGPNDLLKIKDRSEKHVSLGAYDHSIEDKYMQAPRGEFDAEYYHGMIQSNFTLCPGGEAAWSLRFYEAILAGSIPVIHHLHEDLWKEGWWIRNAGYKYFFSKNITNISKTMSSADLKEIADYNYDLFIKYQTFIEGDFAPPATSKYPYNYDKPCLHHFDCHRLCVGNEGDKFPNPR